MLLNCVRMFMNMSRDAKYSFGMVRYLRQLVLEFRLIALQCWGDALGRCGAQAARIKRH